MQGPITTFRLLFLLPFLIRKSKTFSVIPFNDPFQPEWIAEIIFNFESYTKIGAQSAVSMPRATPLQFVIRASPKNLFFPFFNFLVLLIKWNLLLWIWFNKIRFFLLHLILLQTLIIFFVIFSFLSRDPNPQFKLL